MGVPAVDLVREWSEAEFAASAQAWEDLRARSDADPLFMGWDWQWLWWHHHKGLLGGTLSIIACYAGSRLVGLAPFYLHSATHRAGIRAGRMEIIGSTFRDGRGVFSEYLDLIADRAHSEAVVAAVGTHLRQDRRWADLVISNSPSAGVAAILVRSQLAVGGLVREIDHLESHRAELPADFQVYLRTLAGGTRRKLWNQRSKLVNPELVVAGPADVFRAFDLIDSFHQHRWNTAQYVGVARDFHFALAPALIARGALRMSTLYSAGTPLAVMYNVRLGMTEYNIQSGFDPAQGSGLSPGYLHFGYSLEEACRDGLQRFDFLAGQGRHRQYKQDFVTTEFPLVTFQAIRARYLKVLYRAHEFVAGLRGSASQVGPGGE
jgi:CelD/BcsL family acetyltransferase involved in cellulose biosynthesis